MIIDHTTASYRNSSPTDIFAALIYNLNYTYRKKKLNYKITGEKNLSEPVYWKKSSLWTSYSNSFSVFSYKFSSSIERCQWGLPGPLSRLNTPNSVSLSFQDRCLSPLMRFVALLSMFSNKSMYIFILGAPQLDAVLWVGSHQAEAEEEK